MADDPRIAFAWTGLPAYGARLICRAQQAIDEPIAVIATRPNVPVSDVDSILDSPITWINGNRPVTWTELGMRPPELFFETSWATPAFNSLTRQVKRAGGKVVCMLDNRWKGNLRQWVGAAYFRLWLSRFYDAIWGPGVSTRRFCRVLGVTDARVYEYLYSGWTEKFPMGPPLDKRPPRMLFVGQYIRRKGIDHLIEAYGRFAAVHPQWELQLFGSGEWRSQLERMPQATVRPFGQTDEIAAAMRAARFFVLPSRDDHWPLVVHESASSGCALILSTAIGNAQEFATPRNSIIFDAGDASALYAALCQAASKNDLWLRQAGDESQRLASQFGPERFAATFLKICADLLERQPAAAASADANQLSPQRSHQ